MHTTDPIGRRWRARRKLVRNLDLATADGRQTLERMLADDEERVRHAVVDRLGEVPDDWATELLRRVFFRPDEDDLLRRDAFLHLLGRPGDGAIIRAGLRDRSRLIRIEAAR